MNKEKRLYAHLVQMYCAAEQGNANKVIKIRSEFTRLYSEIMPETYVKESLPDLYDMARNKIINAIDPVLFPSDLERNVQLEHARMLISKIPKPE